VSKRTRTANTHGSKWIRRDKRIAIYLRDGYTCAYCGRDLAGLPPSEVTLDHLTPGHTNHHEHNLVTACRSCNSSRQDTPLARWVGAQRAREIRRQARRSIRRWRAIAKSILALAGEDRDRAVSAALDSAA